MRSSERQLLDLLRQELAPDRARELESRLAEEPELRARYEELKRVWSELAPPVEISPSDDFAAQVLDRARGLRPAPQLSWTQAPVWARLGAALALTTGLLFGVGFGHWVEAPPSENSWLPAAPMSLAESYWLTLEDDAVENLESPEN